MTPLHPLRASISCIGPSSVDSYTKFYTERIRYLQSTIRHQDTSMYQDNEAEYQDAVDHQGNGPSFSLQEYVIPAQPRKGKTEGTSPDEELFQVCL
jgi:hypothetical protein